MDNLTCEVCGKVCKKPSSLKSHTRWAHGSGSPAHSQKAELAEYKALEGKVAELVEGFNSLARRQAAQGSALAVVEKRVAPVSTAVAPLAEPPGIGIGGILAVVAILGTALWANTTDSGRAAMAQSEALREAKRRV